MNHHEPVSQLNSPALPPGDIHRSEVGSHLDHLDGVQSPKCVGITTNSIKGR